MLHMCVCMHSRFVENHPIWIPEDGLLISEVVLSQLGGTSNNKSCSKLCRLSPRIFLDFYSPSSYYSHAENQFRNLFKFRNSLPCGARQSATLSPAALLQLAAWGSMTCSYIRRWYKTAGVQTGLSEATSPPPSVRCRCATILLHRADRLPSPILLCAGHLLKRRRVTGAVSPSSETIVRLPVRACHAASPSPSANRLPLTLFPVRAQVASIQSSQPLQHRVAVVRYRSFVAPSFLSR
jgi:hypothetical protein